MVSPATRAMLAQERIEIMRNPEKARTPAELTLSDRFIFRTDPSVPLRAMFHMLDIEPIYEPEDHSERGIARKFHWLSWRKRHIAQFQDSKKSKSLDQIATAARAYYAQLIDEIGDKKIVFKRVKRHDECYFSTNSLIVAEYIRGLISANVGEFGHVYEQSGLERIVVGERAFPATELGRKAAFKYAAEIGSDELKIVRE